MKEELNIAAILKDKPCNLKLYDVAREINVFYGCQVGDDCEIHCNLDEGGILAYNNNGTLIGFTKGMQILKPSKQMLDWSKFAWKKGDVLKSPNYLVIFDRWNKDDYTSFIASFELFQNVEWGNGDDFTTSYFNKASDEEAKEFIKKVEEHYGGKLNLTTLDIDKQPEFKDGDILVSSSKYKYIFIYNKKNKYKNPTGFYVSLNCDTSGCYLSYNNRVVDDDGTFYENYLKSLRIATDSEKQQLFDALAKEGKQWNPDTLQIEDLPKKCEFKAFDKVLVRDGEDCAWKADFFSHYDKQ